LSAKSFPLADFTTYFIGLSIHPKKVELAQAGVLEVKLHLARVQTGFARNMSVRFVRALRSRSPEGNERQEEAFFHASSLSRLCMLLFLSLEGEEAIEKKLHR
jgi:hypothetical protein